MFQWAVGSAKAASLPVMKVTEYIGCDLSLSTVQYVPLPYIPRCAFSYEAISLVEDTVSSEFTT